MLRTITTGIIAAVTLTGCVEAVKKSVTKEAYEECAARGKQFIPGGPAKSVGGLMGHVIVKGLCVGPGDPGYVDPKSTPAPG